MIELKVDLAAFAYEMVTLETQELTSKTVMQGMRQSHTATIALPVLLQLRLEMDKAGWLMMMLEVEEGNLQIWVAMAWN